MFLIPVPRSSGELGRSFEKLFDEAYERFFHAPVPAEGGPRSPALDMTESDGAYSVKVDVPGVPKENVKVSIEGRRVSIEAETQKDEEKKEGDRVVYRERSMSHYARSFTLPGDIDEAASSAKLDNGVLTLTLTKKPGSTPAKLTVS